MIILGLDPGLAILGFGVIDSDGQRSRMIEYGCIYTEAGIPLPTRLKQLYEDLECLITKYRPEAVAIEELFFNKNVKTALTVGHARGIALLCAVQHCPDIYEYTPLQIKQAVVGYGRADKNQVQQMVKTLLKLEIIPKPDDAADGLAVALCHAHSGRMQNAFRIK